MAHLQISCSLLTPHFLHFMLGKCPYLNNLITRLRDWKGHTWEQQCVFSRGRFWAQYKLIFPKVRFDSIVARWHKSPSRAPAIPLTGVCRPRTSQKSQTCDRGFSEKSISVAAWDVVWLQRQTGGVGDTGESWSKSPSLPFKLHWSKENFRREWMRVLMSESSEG